MAIESKICDFGWEAKNFSLKSIDNNFYSLDKLRGQNGILIMFICNHCPYVKAIIKKLKFETEELKKININSVAIMSNDTLEYPEDSFENMKIFSKKYNFKFHYLYDADQIVAKDFDAQCTPEFFGFNSNLELQYRGRIDSGLINSKDKDIKRELFHSMKTIIETGMGPKIQYNSIGCSIKWI